MPNCHGCKWLDRYKEDGNGYCAHVMRSKTYQPSRRTKEMLIPSSCARRPHMERCELYEPGDWKRRFRTEEK